MELQSILKADYLDIIFDNRNKTYGGYELRKNYQHRTMKAITIVLSTALLLIGAHAIASSLKPTDVVKLVPNEREVVLKRIEPPTVPPPPPPPMPPAPVKPAPSVVWTPPVIKPDIEVPEPPATKDDLKDKNPGREKSDGDPNGPPGPPSDIIGDGDVPKPAVVTVPKPNVPMEYVEQMPEFAGNINEYLRRNIQYPQAARDANISGRVVIKFVVNEDGSINGAKVIKGIGGGCEEEAMRVINSMPKWKAGKTNGKAVKVYFTLPVSFKLN